MTDTFLIAADGTRHWIEAGQRHAFRCECGRTHLVSFDLEPPPDADSALSPSIIVRVSGDRRQRHGARLVTTIRGLLTFWRRDS